MTPIVYKPDIPTYSLHATIASHVERAEIQGKGPEPVGHSPTDSPLTSTHTTASTTLTTSQELVSGDILQLPPLPTTLTQPPRLDISQLDLPGSGRGETSGRGEEGSSQGNSGGSEVGATATPEITSRPIRLQEISARVETSSVEDAAAHPVPSEILTPKPHIAAGTTEVEEQPAVVFKEEYTIRAQTIFDHEKSLDIPETAPAKPPIHLIIVNVQSTNGSESGELRGVLIKSCSNLSHTVRPWKALREMAYRCQYCVETLVASTDKNNKYMFACHVSIVLYKEGEV